MIRLTAFIVLVAVYSSYGELSGLPSSAAENVVHSNTHDRHKRSLDWDEIVRNGKWGQWSKCTKECGKGTQVIEKTCTLPPNTQVPCRKIKASCNAEECDDPYTDAVWTDCTQTCDQGTRERESSNGEGQEILCGMKNCSSPLAEDNKQHVITFIMDSSSSGKGPGGLAWFQLKQYVMDTIASIDLEKTIIAVLSYSNDVTVILKPEKRSLNDILLEIWKAPFKAGCTNTANAVKLAMQMMNKRWMKSKERTIVLLTDGANNVKMDKSVRQYTYMAHIRRIATVAVGIGEDIDRSVLKKIGRRRGSATIFVPGYDELPYFTNQLLTKIYN